MTTVHYAPIKVEYINPFLKATCHVFKTMLSCDLVRGKPYIKTGVTPDHDVSGVIGLSGKAVGAVALSVSRNVAISATEAMLGERPSDIDGDVIDVVGELANMIAGNAKAQLEQLEMSIGLPNVIIGDHHTVAFPSGSTPIGIPFECAWGPVGVDVGLCVRAEPAELAAAK